MNSHARVSSIPPDFALAYPPLRFASRRSPWPLGDLAKSGTRRMICFRTGRAPARRHHVLEACPHSCVRPPPKKMQSRNRPHRPWRMWLLPGHAKSDEPHVHRSMARRFPSTIAIASRWIHQDPSGRRGSRHGVAQIFSADELHNWHLVPIERLIRYRN